MKNLQNCIKAVLLASAVVLGNSAGAVPIPVGSTSASDVIFNYDFTASTPAPPYTTLFALFSGFGGSVTVSETLVFDFFTGLDGLGAVTSNTLFSLGTLISTNRNVGALCGAGCLDGVFSIGVRMTVGDGGNFSAPTATGTNAAGASVTITGAQVPEPASLALVGLALAGLALSRKGKLG